jgi:hypothetical protein
LKNNLSVFWKVENRVNMGSRILSLSINKPKSTQNVCSDQNLYINVCVIVIHNTPNWEQHKCPWSDYKMWYIHIIFIRIYSLYGVRFLVTIPIRLILYIIYIAPIVSPPQPTPHPAWSNCKRFSSSVSYKYIKSINHILLH